MKELASEIRCLALPSTDSDNESAWSAVALDMDVWGFGETREEAMKDLEELLSIQVEFATERGELSILDHPANKKWFDLWDQAHNERRPRDEMIAMPQRTEQRTDQDGVYQPCEVAAKM